MIPNLTLFDELLPHLQEGRLEAIEYGLPEHPGGYFSYLRIKLIDTPGGMQFCIKFLHGGMEGSGIYFHSRRELRDHLLCYIDRYHEKKAIASSDLRIGRHVGKLFTKSAAEQLQFFAIMPNKEK